MAKYSDLESKPLETSVTGLYLKDLSLVELKKLTSREGGESDGEVGSNIILELLCSENGESFDDINTPEDLDKLKISHLKAISGDIKEVFKVQGNLVESGG